MEQNKAELKAHDKRLLLKIIFFLVENVTNEMFMISSKDVAEMAKILKIKP
jgi:hypothetical protein